VLETDAPYMAPVPFRGKRNDSGYLPYVVAKIAELKGIPEEEVVRVTAANASALFGLDASSGEQSPACPEKEQDDPGEKR
jgi:TatD DNase family protein